MKLLCQKLELALDTAYLHDFSELSCCRCCPAPGPGECVAVPVFPSLLVLSAARFALCSRNHSVGAHGLHLAKQPTWGSVHLGLSARHLCLIPP